MRDNEDIRDRLIHIADLHFWRVELNPFRLLNKRFLGNLNVALRRRRQFDLALMQPAADAVSATGARHALLTGDFTSTATGAEFRMAAAFASSLLGRGLEVALLPGNHDVYTFEAARAQRFKRYFASFLPATGYPSKATLPGGTPLILVPTVCPNLISSRGRITRVEVERAGALLASCPETVVVGGHYPLLFHTHGYAQGASHRLRGAERLRKLLGNSGKRVLYLSGHVHRFSYVRDPDFPALSHLCTGAFVRRDPAKGTFGEFSEIYVLNAGFRVIHHLLRDAWTREEAVERTL